ncbi:MAG: C25 family cysteine peptidase [Candidatus Krumholzibacteriia bacterium]
MSRRISCLSVTVLTLVLVLPALAADAARELLPLHPGATAATATVEIKHQDAGGLTLELVLDGLTREAVTRDGRSFTRLDLADGGSAGADGQAALPTYSRLVALPAGVGVSARVVVQETRSLGTMTLEPAAPIVDRDKAAPAFDAGWYAAAPVFGPGVSVGEPALMHGLRVVPVTFRPVGYDPASGEVTVASRLTVEVTFAGHDGRNDKAATPRLIPESFATMFEDEVVGFVRDASVATGPGTYILICPNNPAVVSIVESLAQWRRRQGYTVQVVTTATTGTTNTAIKAWLQDRYATAEPPLEFVTLVGDANGAIAIPTFHETLSGYGGEGDHEYTLLDGADVLSDIHIGRLTATSTTELQTIVDKIVRYESDPDLGDPSWFTTAGLTGDPSSSGYSCIWVNQFVKQQLQHLGYTRIDTIWGGNFLSQMLATINQGESLFTYRGYLNMSGMSASYIMSTTNGRQLPFAVIMTCYTGSFEGETTARNEAFLRAPNGGGVAAIGTATTGTHTRYNNCMFLGTTNGVLNSPEHRVGPSLTRGKLNLYKNYWTNETDRVWIWSTWNNLMGDSATEIFTGVPAAIAVAYPAQVALGANALPVTVTLAGAPVEGARVAVYQEGRVQSFAYTDAAGEAVMDIDGALQGDVLVTVTGRNLRPHLGQAAVGTVVRSLDFDGVTLQEVAGNGDQLANPGETLDLAVRLINHGTAAVTGASAELKSVLPYLTLLDATGDYGTVPAGATATATYRVRVEADAPGGETPALRLDAVAGGDAWTSLVALPIHGPRGALNSLVFGGPGGTLDPGENGTLNFTLGNLGDRATSGVTATLTCASQWISVTDATGAWTFIPAGGAAAQTGTFAISIAADCYPGHLASLELALTFAEGGTQVLSYPVVVGTAADGDPTGPDAYGYYAFDDADSDPLAPDYAWVEIAGIGANTGLADNANWADDTRQFDLPFAFTYYGETYQRVSICSNGWLSFGDTNIRLYRNWTLPADGSPDAMICAFWDDLAMGQVYTYHDAAEHRYIVQWDAFQTSTGGSSYTGNCTFEIILYDPVYHPTDTGDGLIVIQYQDVTVYGDETTYFTTGIQNRARDVGLTYAYGNHYAGGAAAVQANRAIAFRTVVPQAQGQLSGQVTNASGGGTPVPGAIVTVLANGRALATGADGHYAGNAPAGTWDIAVHHASCAPDTAYGVVITEDQTTVLNFSLADIGGPTIANTTQLADTEDTGGPYLVQANITDLTGVASYALHYTSSSTGGPFTVPLSLLDGASGLVEGAIPGQPDGTRVQYWLTATDVLGNGSVDPLGAPWPTYAFMVATVTEIASDSCETPDGWTVNAQGTDTATTGIWEDGDPIGTEGPTTPVQPEDDHTPAPGVNCWFTGQHTPGETAGFNDVDGGVTSLSTPIYDVAGYGTVQVSYWRWFSNDQGFSPGEDPWVVQVSNDGGANWTEVENTVVSNAAWQQVAFVLNDHYADPSQLRLRFLAEDLGGGSLVEAAVDDLRITASTAVADTQAPTVTVTAPAGGSAYTTGQTLHVAWSAGDDVGVVHARVWLSLDDGATYDQLLGEGPLSGTLDWTVDVPFFEPSYDCRVRVEVLDGMQRSASDDSDRFTITVDITDVPPPAQVGLFQNHPNPFNPQTVIVFDVPRLQDVRLRIYDVQGRLVRTLVAGPQPAGRHEAVWRGRDDHGGEVSSGLYFYRLTTGGQDLVRKMTLLK